MRSRMRSRMKGYGSTHAPRHPLVATPVVLLVVLLAVLTGAVATAQMSPAAGEALEAAREAVAQAQNDGAPAYPDAPGWRDALRQGELAARLAPGALEPLRFLAETYTTTRWYARAWDAWQTYREAGGDLDPAALASATDVGTTLAYLRYQEGDIERAQARYREVTELNPDDPEAFVWLGRTLLEQGRPDDAIPYWERAVELDPDDAGSAYFLALARDEVAFGRRGAQSFYDGVRLYEEGDTEGAFERFRDATRTNPSYAEAFVWAGRTALELGRPDAAVRFWRRVVDLDPEDERASYFLVLAQDQVRWGVEAVTAFRDGVARYEAGDLTGARAGFVSATEANAEYSAAWAWRGRTAFEQGEYADARSAYERALELDPDNATYLYFFEEATRRLGD